MIAAEEKDALSLVLTADGSHTVYSPRFAAHYHSMHGAVQESRHVFVEAAFHQIANATNAVSILEMGLGTGLNVLLTYLEAKKLGIEVFYTALEQFPISVDLSKKLNYTEVLQCGESESSVFSEIHEVEWGKRCSLGENFSFLKEKIDIENYVAEESSLDIVYFDAFAPQAQPALWQADLLKKLFTFLKPEGVLTTYCAQGAFKRNLRSVGFEVIALPGPPGKREMTLAVVG